MAKQYDVSVILCTYNRCDILPRALESLLAQNAGEVRYEIIVVDNNSTDKTREVVESFITDSHTNLRYLFEGQQGKPYALNTGIKAARSPIIAITDDDLRVAPDWVATIKRAFDEHPEVVLVGSRVLPRWETEPPTWLTKDHWAPLALQDRGGAPLYSNSENPFCLLGISLRREVFDRIGFFSVKLLKIGASSCEDHELQLRLWRGGYQCLYVPEITVIADVQSERVGKAYHRQWHAGHGKSMAIMGLHEAIDKDGKVVEKIPNIVTLFGVPSFVYRQLIRNTGQWIAALARRQATESFAYENEIREYSNYIRERARQNAKIRKHSVAAEIGTFIKAITLKRTFFSKKKTVIKGKDT